MSDSFSFFTTRSTLKAQRKSHYRTN
jgi:hypothetical protein